MRRPGLTLTLVSALVLGCGHTEPFHTPDYGTDQPFDPGPPVRLTANSGDDNEISSTPDGRYLVYTLNGSCAAFLPAHEGRDSVWLCAPPVKDIRDGFTHPDISATHRLAFVLTRQRDFEAGPFYKAVMVTPLADFSDTSEVIPVPFVTTVDGILHVQVSRLAWLRGDSLAILADSIVYLTDPADTTRPRVFVPLALPGPVTGMQPGRGGSVLYLRVAGDSRVLAWDKTTGGLSTIHDFGSDSAGIVAVGNRHLAAVIPGAVVRIRLENNSADTVPTYSLVIAELAMTPDGSDIIASAVDTTGPLPPVARTTDLYRLNP